MRNTIIYNITTSVERLSILRICLHLIKISNVPVYQFNIDRVFQEFKFNVPYYTYTIYI